MSDDPLADTLAIMEQVNQAKREADDAIRQLIDRMRVTPLVPLGQVFLINQDALRLEAERQGKTIWQLIAHPEDADRLRGIVARLDTE